MIAWPIKCLEPFFKKLFIHSGIFHILMAYFCAIGKYISNYGLISIIIESELIGSGSGASFISGKDFNKCKLIYAIVALALEQEQFEMFLDRENVIITAEFKNIFKDPNSPLNNEEEAINEVLSHFEKFQKKCLLGEYGKQNNFMHFLFSL